MRAIYYGSILFFLTFMCFFTLSGVSDSLWNILWSALSGYGVYRFVKLAYGEYMTNRVKGDNKENRIIIFFNHISSHGRLN